MREASIERALANEVGSDVGRHLVATTELVRSATIRWEGDVAHGRGTIATESGTVSAAYSFGTRFSGEPGTNPEELLAASHAACFTMALSAELTRAGHPPKSIDTKAFVHLQRTGSSYEISAIDLVVSAIVDGILESEFQRLATNAKQNCPLSRALSAVPISLQATLTTGE
jgi:lipoyl-dependent peroxiredoxin